MAVQTISPMIATHSGDQRDFQDDEYRVTSVNAPCTSLNDDFLTSWLHKEHTRTLELLQAAWSVSLRSYTGSDDVWFSCLDSRSHSEPEGFNNSTCFGAKSVVYVNEEHEHILDNAKISYLRKYDLAIEFLRGTDTNRPSITIRYRPSVLPTELATMIAATVDKAAEEIVFHIDSLIEVLDICSDGDVSRICQWNSASDDDTTSMQYVHQVISQRCSTQPDRIAVSAWDGELTYAELDSLSSTLASRLRQLGVGPEIFVPLVFDKSKWAVVSILSVLKAGGAYLFLNPSYPMHYNSSLCSPLCPKVALCLSTHSMLARSFATIVLTIGEESSKLLDPVPVSKDFTLPATETRASNAMYITFTSGTTGAPKGVVTEHYAFYSMAMANGKALNITPATRMLQFASYTFDPSNRDILITLMFGGVVCIPSESERLNDLSGFINRHSVSFASLTPTLASALTPASCPSLQGLVLGGEPIAASHISTWAKQVQLFNAYGVSESTGIAALASNIEERSSPSNIGFGCGSTLWVVTIDQPDRLAPIGALGELVIEGPSVARGYIGDKERTQKQFTSNLGWDQRIRNQIGGKHSWKRTYRTGDLVRYNFDGSLRFVGRRDHQVKINGQRLELATIEHHIAACVEVTRSGFLHIAVAVVKNEANGSTKLLAFLGLDMSKGLDDPSEVASKHLRDKEDLKAALKQDLLRKLPTYMVPFDFIFLQHIPLTTSGKVNRTLLKTSAMLLLSSDEQSNDNVPHSNGNNRATMPQEDVLIQAWAKVLSVKDTSIAHHDSFFRLGGDSIAAIRMVAFLRERGFVMSVSDVFRLSTFSAMASVLTKDSKSLPPAAPAPFSLIKKSESLLDTIHKDLGVQIGDIEDVYPCTHMQKSLIALTAQNPRAYIGSYTWQLVETLDMERFQNAWRAAWLYNPILRTRVVQTPDGIFQVVLRNGLLWNTVTNINGGDDDGKSMSIAINRGPLVQFSASKDAFRLDIHHSLFDEWSLGLIIANVERAYAGHMLHTQPFSPFVQHLLNNHDTTTEDFWRQEFAGLDVEHFPVSEHKSNRMAERMVVEHSLQLDGSIFSGYTLSSVLRLAWAIVLWQQTGSEDVVFGATVSGRNANIDEIGQLSGPTLATLPVRIKLPTSEPIHKGLSQVQHQFANMMNYEQTGLMCIRRFGREAAEACKFQNLLVVQSQERKNTSPLFKTTANLGSSSENATAFATYPIVLTCRPEDSGVTLTAAFDPACLAPATVQSILRQTSHVIHQIVTYDSMCIADISLIPSEDMSMLSKWNCLLPTAVDTCIHDRIRQMCIARPEALAVHSNELDLTYAQIENYSNQFAQCLTGTGIKQGDFVPLLMTRSPWVAVTVVAVLKTGAAFVLMDLSYPIQRLRTMCSMLKSRFVIAQGEHTKIYNNLPLPVIIFDPKDYAQNQAQHILEIGTELLPKTVAADAPACVVFSSGSTGLPKGIVLQHRALSTSAAVMRNHGMLATNSRVFHFASFAFDISIGEILFSLAAGACICVPQEDDRMGNPAKAAYDLKVTWALLTPSVINLFDPSDVPTLEVLGSAGEPLTAHIVNHWAHRVKLFGMYAPAECTVISHIARILPNTHQSNIGRSPGAVSWVADPSNHDRLVPIGTVGELIVEGPVVSSGYLNDQKKTDEVFITSPPWLSKVRPECGRLYKTGDLVRQTPTGSLLFVGRKDDQVKMHGQRLEVGEVERCIISSCKSVRFTAVECIKVAAQNNRVSLVALICPQSNEEWGQFSNDKSSIVEELKLLGPLSNSFYSTIRSLETSLRELLPAYMIPSFFIPLFDVPLTLSGKVNRRLIRDQIKGWPLKKLEVYQLASSTLPAEEVPISEHSWELQRIIGQALNLDPESVSLNSNFFGLGGDSISAMHVSMLARRRGIRLTVADIFTRQTLSQIALACVTDKVDDSMTLEGRYVSHESAEPTNKSSQYHGIASDKLLSQLPQEIKNNVMKAIPTTEFQTMTLHNFYSRYLWIPLPDSVNQENLLDACDQLVQKHSILRTDFYTKDDKSLVQLILRKVHVSFVRISGIEDLEKHCTDDSLTMGVPINGELGFQVQLVTVKHSGMFLLLRLPHALFDGVSLAIICDDLSSAYSRKPIPPCAQFSDHIRHVQGKRIPDTYNTWKEVLGKATMTSLDKRYLYKTMKPGEGWCPRTSATLEQPRVVTATAETLPISPPSNITMATLVKLAWAITLSRLFSHIDEGNGGKQGLNDVVFGQVIHGRGLGMPHEDRIVGPCLNIIPVRVQFPLESNKLHLLDQVQQQHIQTMPVENLGLDEIAQNCTSWEAGTKFGSFVRFQNFTNNDESTCTFDGHTSETVLYSLPNRPSRTANVLVVPHGHKLTITMTVSNQVLDQDSSNYVAGYFCDVIRSLASQETTCEYLA
ncbi:acetyl-CoA synthetase-like protein [Polychaeton citri CBS 116435]|uniref:Acetyl-CoA synthetase-like protein n=1 Tax=Polychaeton citri CBS 116435 TaxID=1314669 RepID=A0A9P4QAV4_9PEZI|nr:acetyl-CoA synthetase-like protein [Polychaeton citri CBS 116435]